MRADRVDTAVVAAAVGALIVLAAAGSVVAAGLVPLAQNEASWVTALLAVMSRSMGVKMPEGSGDSARAAG